MTTIYECEQCKYETTSKSLYERHKESKKHKKLYPIIKEQEKEKEEKEEEKEEEEHPVLDSKYKILDNGLVDIDTVEDTHKINALIHYASILHNEIYENKQNIELLNEKILGWGALWTNMTGVILNELNRSNPNWEYLDTCEVEDWVKRYPMSMK
jgi:hypothetical protein